MIARRSTPGATTLTYRFIELNNQVQLLSLYEARSLKNESGVGSFDHIPVVEDDLEIIKPFYKEFHAMLTPILSTVLLDGNFGQYDEVNEPNITWNFAIRPAVKEPVTEFVPLRHYVQPDMVMPIDLNIEHSYKYYALYKWFLVQNIVPHLSQKYQMAFMQVLDELKSNIRHNNNNATRASRPYNIY